MVSVESNKVINMSGYHRNRKCGPCSLFGKTQTRYAHFCSLSVGEQLQYILNNTSTVVIVVFVVHKHLKVNVFDLTPNMFHPGEKKEKMKL